jgi:hypothetical protein
MPVGLDRRSILHSPDNLTHHARHRTTHHSLLSGRSDLQGYRVDNDYQAEQLPKAATAV